MNSDLCQFCRVPLIGAGTLPSCPECGVRHFLPAESVAYENDYFGEEYRKHYGRTYLEDRENLQKKMGERLHRLEKFTDLKGKHLLEIGSAAGFLLDLAQKKNMIACGWEISASMTDYANSHGWNTTRGDFLSNYERWRAAGETAFDVVAAFYVLEHIPDQAAAWDAFQQLVKPGGHLLLSLPSVYGPTYFFHPQRYVSEHPADHFVDYSPSSLSKTGRRFGFRMLAAWPEGIHPGRFPLGNFFPLRQIYSMMQRSLAFSDTMFAILQRSEAA